MMENLHWLFYAYSAGWLFIFLYLFWISRRERTLRRRVADLQARIDERWTHS